MSSNDCTDHEKANQLGVALPARPVVYEINTWLWLRELSRKYGRRVSLADVPAADWDAWPASASMLCG